jgi:hypothetical protein
MPEIEESTAGPSNGGAATAPVSIRSVDSTPKVPSRPKSEVEAGQTLLQKIADHVEELVTINVVTAITKLKTIPDNFKNTENPDFYFVPDTEVPPEGMQTRINIVTADVSVIVSEGFLTSDREELRKLHMEMVSKAQDSLIANVKELKDLALELMGRKRP